MALLVDHYRVSDMLLDLFAYRSKDQDISVVNLAQVIEELQEGHVDVLGVYQLREACRQHHFNSVALESTDVKILFLHSESHSRMGRLSLGGLLPLPLVLIKRFLVLHVLREG